jgi:hypothetical protein
MTGAGSPGIACHDGGRGPVESPVAGSGKARQAVGLRLVMENEHSAFFNFHVLMVIIGRARSSSIFP